MSTSSTVFSVLTVFAVASVSEAEISFNAARRIKVNDPIETYERSLSNFDRAYVGSFKFNSITMREDENKAAARFEGHFVINGALNGTAEVDQLSVRSIAIYGCLEKGGREALLSKMDSVAVREGTAAIKKMENLIEKLGPEKPNCIRFVAVEKIKGDIEEIYKSRYELIFEDAPYVLFISRNSISKTGKLTGLDDVMVYNKTFMGSPK